MVGLPRRDNDPMRLCHIHFIHYAPMYVYKYRYRFVSSQYASAYIITLHKNYS
jgi:hypothetical protein